MSDATMRFPAVPLALGVASGVAACAAGGVAALWLSAAAALLALIFYRRRLVWASVAAVAFFAGLFSASLGSPKQAPPDCLGGEEGLWTGVVERHELRAASQLCDVRLRKGFLCRLVLSDISPAFRSGDIIAFKASLEALDSIAYAPGQSSEAQALRSRGYAAKALARAESCRLIGLDNSFKYRLRRFADDVADHIYASPLQPSTSRLIVAATLGDGSAAPDGTVEAYRASGIAHLLCVSGFHVGVVVALLSLLLYPLRLWRRAGRLRYLLLIGGVWLYALLAGAQPPVLRAAVMISVFLLAAFLQRSSESINALALAVAIILLFSPLSLYSTGFQLSVSAVLGLLFFARLFNPVGERYVRLHRFAGIFAASLAATLGSLPVLLHAFHRLPPLFLVANVVGMMLFPLLLAGGWAVAALSAMGLDMKLPAAAVDKLAGLIDKVALRTGSISHPAFEGIYPTATATLMLLAAIVVLACALSAPRGRNKALAIMLSGLLFATAACEPRADADVPPAFRSGDIIISHDKVIVHPDSASDGLRWPLRADYMLLDRGADAFDIDSLLRRCRPDTLLLDAGLSPGRRRRAERAAAAAAVPVRADFRRARRVANSPG